MHQHSYSTYSREKEVGESKLNLSRFLDTSSFLCVVALINGIKNIILRFKDRKIERGA